MNWVKGELLFTLRPLLESMCVQEASPGLLTCTGSVGMLAAGITDPLSLTHPQRKCDSERRLCLLPQPHTFRTSCRQLTSASSPIMFLRHPGSCAGERQARDVFFDGQDAHVLTGPKIATRNTHGTGCTLASAIAAHLALGLQPLEAVRAAKAWLGQALQASASLRLGQGQHGPVNHG